VKLMVEFGMKQGEEVAPTTIKELKAMINALDRYRKDKEQVAGDLKTINGAIAEQEAKIIAKLEDNDLANFAGDEIKVSRKNYTSVKFPKGGEDKSLVWEYIRTNYGDDALDGMLMITSATFNKFYQSENETQKAAGNFNFEMPGVAPASSYTGLSVRKK